MAASLSAQNIVIGEQCDPFPPVLTDSALEKCSESCSTFATLSWLWAKDNRMRKHRFR